MIRPGRRSARPALPAAAVRWRLTLVPAGSVLAGSATALLPFVVSVPALPPFGLLLLLGWSLLRTALWPAWVALPLGFADDLMTGNPIGTAMVLWTATLLALQLIDRAVAWRDHWVDWAIAAAAIQFCTGAGWLIAGVGGGRGAFVVAAGQAAVAILCYPAAVRIVALLDRWRLKR